MSRTRRRRAIGGAELRRQLEAEGIVVRCPSNQGLAEEAPVAYKDVERVVDVVEAGGLRDASPGCGRSAWSRADRRRSPRESRERAVELLPGAPAPTG